MDFVVARFGDNYGFISKGKKRVYGFRNSFDEVVQLLKKYGEHTFAIPMEIPFEKHQREWQKSDNIYLNKLTHLKQQTDSQYRNFLMRGLSNVR